MISSLIVEAKQIFSVLKSPLIVKRKNKYFWPVNHKEQIAFRNQYIIRTCTKASRIKSRQETRLIFKRK